MDAISSMNYDYIASGHYAKVVHPLLTQVGNSVLELSEDMVCLTYTLYPYLLSFWARG